MRIRDWSSDVCSSDLLTATSPHRAPGSEPPAGSASFHHPDRVRLEAWSAAPGQMRRRDGRAIRRPAPGDRRRSDRHQIGRAPCRERGCQYVEISVVPVELKKKTHTKYINTNQY